MIRRRRVQGFPLLLEELLQVVGQPPKLIAPPRQVLLDPFDASGKTRHRVFHPAPAPGCPLEQIRRRNPERMRKLRQQKQADVSNPGLDETDMGRRNAGGRRELAQRELPLRSESLHTRRATVP